MSSPDVNPGQFGIHGPAYTPPVDSTAPPTHETQIQDSIAASDQMAALMYLMFLPQFPQLIPPDKLSPKMAGLELAKNTLAIVMQIFNTLSKIVTAIADAWNKNIKQQAQRQAEDAKEAEIKGDQVKWSQKHSINAKAADDASSVISAATEDSMRSALAAGLSRSGIQAQQGDSVAQANLPFVAASLMIAASFFQDLLGGAKSSLGAVNTIQGAFSNFSTAIPGNMAAELGLIGAMFGVGAAYKGSANALTESAPDAPKDAETAKNYALSILQIVQSKELNGFIEAMLTQKMKDGVVITAPGKEQFTAMAKLVLLSVSLALLYKLGMTDNKGGTNWIRGADFQGMLKGTTAIAGNSLEAQIIEQIYAQLKLLPSGTNKDPGLQEKFRESLIAYMDSNPSVDSLLDVGKVLEDVYTTIPQTPGTV